MKFINKLKKHGLAVPPTTRLIKINGTNYIALTDLSKFGDVQSRYLDDVIKLIGVKEGLRIEKFVDEQTKKARELGIEIRGDTWEYIIDTKQKRAYAFILDLASQKFFI